MIAGDEDSEHVFGDNTIAKKVKPAQEEEEVRIADCDQCQTTMVLEQCGDPHPAPKPALATNPPDSGDPQIVQDAEGECGESNGEQEGDEDDGDPENRCTCMILNISCYVFLLPSSYNHDGNDHIDHKDKTNDADHN